MKEITLLSLEVFQFKSYALYEKDKMQNVSIAKDSITKNLILCECFKTNHLVICNHIEQKYRWRLNSKQTILLKIMAEKPRCFKILQKNLSFQVKPQGNIQVCSPTVFTHKLSISFIVSNNMGESLWIKVWQKVNF